MRRGGGSNQRKPGESEGQPGWPAGEEQPGQDDVTRPGVVIPSTEIEASPPPRRREAGRIVRRVAIGLGIAVGSVLVLALVALGLVTTSFGGERIRRFALPRVNEAIAGQLEVGSLRTRLDGVELADVVLRDPEGRVVARVGKLVLGLALRPLLSDRVQIDEVRIERPELELVQTAAGLNLSRAIAARPGVVKPSAPADDPAAEPARWQIALRQLLVKEGSVAYRDLRDASAPVINVQKIEAEADGSFAMASGKFAGRLSLDARSQRPLAAPMHVRIAGNGTAAEASGDLRVVWADAQVAAKVRSAGPDRQSVVIENITVAPELVQAFLSPPAPSVAGAPKPIAKGGPLLTAVEISGTVERQADLVTTDLALSAADARGQLAAQVDVAKMQARRLRLDMKSLDLGAIVAKAPRSKFDLLVEGDGGGLSLETASGQVRMTVPVGRIDARTFGPVKLAARAERGTYTLDAFDIRLPGLRLTARGQGTQQALGFDAQVAAADLALLARSLRLPRDLALAGNGQLAARVAGPLAAPRVELKGRFANLQAAGSSFRDLGLEARVADVRQAPAGTSVVLTVARGRAGGRPLEAVTVRLAPRGADGFTLAMAARQPLPISLDAEGRASRVGPTQTVDLTALTLGYPEARWQLSQPARIAIGEGTLAIKGLELQAGAGQRLAVDLDKRGQRLRSEVVVASFDFASLPALVMPAGRLRGKVDLSLKATGALPRPDAEVELRLADAAFERWKDLGLTLKARHQQGRVVGGLTAAALGAAHEAKFDLPTAWPPPSKANVSLEAKIGAVDLASLPTAGTTIAADRGAKVRGRASAQLSVQGRASDPALALKARVDGLELGGERVQELIFEIADEAGQPLTIDASAIVGGHKSRLHVETPIVLASWARRPPRGEEILGLPFKASADVDRLSLASLAPRRGGKPSVTGTLSAKAALLGPISRLSGTVKVDAADIATTQTPPTTARLTARLGQGRSGIDVDLGVFRREQQVAKLVAAIGAGVGELLAGRDLAGVGVDVKGHLGPLVVQRLVAGAETGRRQRRPFRAEVEANLTAGGTLGAPRADLRLAMRDATLSGRALGSARAQIGYRDRKPGLELKILSAGGGQLALTADAQVDLSLPALKKGLDPKEIPIESRLQAKALDLAFFSGIVDLVRTAEGRLDADARFSGRAGAPQLIGKVNLRGGRVVLAGYGDLRDIEVAARGDAREMALDRLFVRSGGGKATITARAVREPDGRKLTIDGRADLERFRLQTDGQPLGELSLKARARGAAAPDLVDIGTTIDEAHMEIAEGDRRRLQSLKRPDDVVLLSHGEPIDRKEARRLEELTARLPAPPAQKAAEKTLDEVTASATETVTPPSPPPRRTRMTIEAPRNLWVRGPDLNLEVGLDPGFVVSQAERTRVFGTVRVRRGFVEVLGRRFDLAADSSIRFTGNPERPTLAIDATYKAESADTTVVAHIEGLADALSFSLRSPDHPEYGDTELLSLIATGRLPDDERSAGGSASGQAASLVGGLLADRVQKVLTAHLPIDVLNIEPGEGIAGTKLEAGTYLGDDIYVAYIGRVGGDPMDRENRNELHLEYQLTSRWSFEATYGDARQGSVDLLWTRHY